MSLAHLRLALAFTPVLISCSLTVARPDACSSAADCRAGFGWGSTCTDDGLCAPPSPPDRCTGTLPPDLFEDPAAHADRILIGALYDHEVHLDSIQATMLALEEVNASEGLEGRRFALATCDYGERFDDDLETTEAAAQGARWLSTTVGVSAIVGPRGSSRTVSAFEALEGADVLMISPSATSPELTTIDETMPTDASPGLLWRTVPPDDFQAQVIVDDMSQRDVSSLAIIAQAGSYGDGLSSLIDARFRENIGDQVSIFRYDTSLFGAVADASASGAEEVVFISSDIVDYVGFLDGAVASDELIAFYDTVGIFLPDAAYNVQLFDVTVEARVLFDNVRGSRPAPATGVTLAAFSAAYSVRFGENPQSSGFTVHSYDAAWLAVYAHAWAHFNEDDLGGRSLARGLRKISECPGGCSPTPLRPDGWPALVDAAEAGASIDVAGGSGDLDYDPDTEETTAPIEIWGISETSPGMFELTRLGTVG